MSCTRLALHICQCCSCIVLIYSYEEGSFRWFPDQLTFRFSCTEIGGSWQIHISSPTAEPSQFSIICTFSPKTDPTTSWDDATQNGFLFPHPIQSYFFNCYLCFSGREKKTSSFALSVESWIYKLQVARLQPLYNYIGLWDPPRPHVAILHCCRIPSTSPGQWCPQLVSKVAVAKSRN